MAVNRWKTFILHQIDSLFEPISVASLALTRIFLGVLLLLDTIHERGLSRADILWSEEMLDRCRFGVLNWLQLQLMPPAIYAYYAILMIGLLGVTVGYHYRISSLVYTVFYWVLLLQDRSRWNNHSYLFGLLSILFLANDSNRKWSIDVWLGRIPASDSVERWQYFLIRFQIFLVYFYAGLKKTNPEWLLGYSMVNLSSHRVFTPIRVLVGSYWIDYYLIHLGGFLFDLLVGFLFAIHRTRLLAFVLCSTFNLINSQLFQIGMFPWVMLALMPIFCSPDWPLKLINCKKNTTGVSSSKSKNIPSKKVLKLTFVLVYVLIQLLLPFAFVILHGFTTWTTGIYGYNWDMMVHNWNHIHTRVEVHAMDPNFNQTLVKYLNYEAWTQNHRWSHHADMAKQFALCVKDKLEKRVSYKNVQVYVDVWTSLNGRFAQRIFDPKVDLVQARWSPFRKPDWVIPIYPKSNYWRRKLLYDFGHHDRLLTDTLRNGWLVFFLTDRAGGSFVNYIDDQLEQSAHLIVFDQLLQVHEIAKDGSQKRFYISQNGSVRLEPGSLVHIDTIGPSESYFALIYPKQSRIKRQMVRKDKDRNRFVTSLGLLYSFHGTTFIRIYNSIFGLVKLIFID